MSSEEAAYAEMIAASDEKILADLRRTQDPASAVSVWARQKKLRDAIQLAVDEEASRCNFDSSGAKISSTSLAPPEKSASTPTATTTASILAEAHPEDLVAAARRLDDELPSFRSQFHIPPLSSFSASSRGPPPESGQSAVAEQDDGADQHSGEPRTTTRGTTTTPGAAFGPPTRLLSQQSPSESPEGRSPSSSRDASVPLRRAARPNHEREAGEHVEPSTHDDESESAVYLVGHSLGLQPRETESLLTGELQKWRQLGVNGHFSGEYPWMPIDENATPMVAKVLGAHPDEVCIMNTLSVNLHLMFTTFYRPERNRRYKILYEQQAFPSDYFVFQSQAELHDLDPADALLPVQADADTDLVDEERIVHLLKTDREIAVLCLGAVQYYSGQLFDIARLTKIAHENGVVALFDLAHAAGNVPLHLHEWGVDAACFCTYKYLNSGPGCIGGFFVHEQHLATMGLLGGGNVNIGSSPSRPGGNGAETADGELTCYRERSSLLESSPRSNVPALPKSPLAEGAGGDDRHPLNREWSREVGTKRLAGWWSHDKSSRFEMKHQLHPARGAKAFSLSNPGVMLMMCLISSLRVFDQTSMAALRGRSARLTAFLWLLLDAVRKKHAHSFNLLPKNAPPSTASAGASTAATTSPSTPPAVASPPAPASSGATTRTTTSTTLALKTASSSTTAPFRVITPSEPWRRGAMLTIKFTDGTLCQQLHARIEKRGVVVDYRKPDALRIAPAPLYNTFEDLAKLFVILDEELAAFCSATTTSGVRPEEEY